MSTTAETVAATAGPIGRIGATFMMVPETAGLGKQHGFQGLGFYTAGRGGVLGDVHPDVVTAAFGFFHPDAVAHWWAAGTAVLPARQAADLYTQACHDWGRARLAEMTGLDRLVELASRAAAAVHPAGLSLFAGWRAQPVPDDAPAAAAQLLHVLREHRGSCHIIAVRACGLTPFEAMVAKGGGAAPPKMFGWDGVELPDTGHLLGRREECEALTDRLTEPAYDVLSPSERDELVALVGAVSDHLG